MSCLLNPRGVLALAVLATAGGCTPIINQVRSPLARPQMSPDSVVLDVFFIRIPFDDPEANGPLWAEIDEQHFPAGLRRRLVRNGFRAGLVGGQIPVGLSQLLELGDKPVPSGASNQTNLGDFSSEPRVLRRHLQLRAGRRSEIVTSGVHDELPVLIADPDGLRGQTYSKAQGVLAVKAFSERDGRVRLDLVPELHYGESQQRYVGTQGALRLEAGRPRRAFDPMAVSATLAPGHMLVLSSLPSRPGSLGHHFFTQESGGQLEQKLLVIRLAQTQHDDLFALQDLLPPDEPEE